ncbi:hypothetical protein M409DRAFT_23844 [Zasmidium cellare ATCC 36951]|uniref:Enoyl reductase (ER) domain-containing protein n=1 Tax=Zasmidium cellare ATCC 36951 TaxID=1080233 RepID=A0A6A6CL21_ZASCE|nr:uncharacterized protein M409DRAFT_23844 [Zasmidium cellare ATCC 36951]KAF2166116.1 hypothetical protein M409DRAFT_23844 [Zasmidium cellare ATCC 36951]
MYQAQITGWGSNPTATLVPDLPTPNPEEIRIKVTAVGIHRIVRARAAGKHYSSAPLPHIPGVDGVGTTDDGKEVYFFSFEKGVLAEYVNLPRRKVFPLPEGADPVQVAGGMNAALSSWMALKYRTSNLPAAFAVLILGATSASGRAAIAIARHFGAKTVIGVARDQAALDILGLGTTIVLSEEAEETDFSGLDDVDLVLDYVYGPVTKHLLASLKAPKPVLYVHIGALSTPAIDLPGSILRSKDITIRGSGLGSWSVEQCAAEMPELLKVLLDIPPLPTRVIALRDIEKGWDYQGKERLVVVP